MTNDIRKHIMLIESIILDESFKDAQIKFSTFTSGEEVKQYIDKFKELSKRNIIKGQDKDIGTWIKGDWDSFKKFIDNNSAVVTKRQSKVEQKKDSIVVYKDEEKQVVVPFTKEASIQYGKNTAWCTAYTEARNQFIDYFYIKKITLFYVLFADGNKYACAYHPEEIECFDKEDKSMVFGKFEEATGISKKDVQEWYNSNKTKIEDSRDLNKASEESQLGAVNQNGLTIKHIDNPSEEVQLAAIKQNGNAIKYIDNPSEEVQIAAVKNYGYAIEWIKNPSEELKLAAVQDYGDVIKYIDNPSETVQLAAVKQTGYAIKYIDNPSEELQLAAVKQTGYAIEWIKNPSEDVQLAAVQQYGQAIRYIDNPSEAVQLSAVSQNGSSIIYIKNPTEKVKALHKKL